MDRYWFKLFLMYSVLLLYITYIWISCDLHNVRDQPYSLGLFCIWFPFGMYALVYPYLFCVALSTAIAVQHFWYEDEFCQNLNTNPDVKWSSSINVVGSVSNKIKILNLPKFS